MNFESSTISVPQAGPVPRHIAIIMDGNGRWARQRFLPRAAGHRRGLEAVRVITRACVERGVGFLTLFAFSSENWRRPKEEVSFLMDLFVMALEQEVAKLHENNIRLRIVGDLGSFEPRLVRLIRQAEALTAGNSGLTLTIAANYGGRWDILQAVNRMVRKLPERTGGYREADLAPFLSMSYAPEPDLFIRTGGEQRVSNFLLWQLAYTEFYFTDELWPDFDAKSLARAIESYRQRERRFGRTSEQLASAQEAAQGSAQPRLA
ncbi:MAG TPA: polyprenyl diphosphate synthase [Burkholderiales bacterium]|jgi:undecaprenyl diphosphate synthase|nr:polyprenyl diphosphate synthase [Burkholderiales bacterium]